ncbi:MAG: YbaB/EbfC family nucleoid-associated protein [Candidatus Dormibacteraeota bacterium]|nr:YbaB/EbfC family nucleoid-associated protein [Candidatus Dormibacteraeota bacterium]
MPNPQQNMMRQLQQMQARMAKVQEELSAMSITGSAGGGVVTVTVDGQQNVRAVTIEPEALEEGPEMLADLVLAAISEAMDQSRQRAASEMGQLTAGLGLPPGLL